MLEVLVASSALGLHARLELRIQRLLGVEVLEDGLDDHVGSGHAGAGHVRAQPRLRSRAFRRIAQALGEQLARRACSAGSMYSAARSCSVTVKPRSAHQAAMSPPMTPAPTTCTWRDLGSALAAGALEPVLQQEHAHQVARGRR